MSNTSTQYQLPEKGAAFQTVTVSTPTPGPNEISIRTKAIGLNPLDWKNQKFGILVKEWPAVLGGDAAGVVESVGASVKNFKVGDEVFNLAGTENRAGAFQEIITVPEHMAAIKPLSLSWEEAASIPVCFMSALNCVATGLKISLPFIDLPAIKTSTYDSILVLGGSSGVGAAAIQILRLALPEATILATSSEAHHARLTSLGATKLFDRSTDLSVVKAATPDGTGVDCILDAVGAALSQPAILGALRSSGPRKYTHVSIGPDIPVPEGVTKNTIFGRSIFGEEGGKEILPAAARLVEQGRYKLPTNVEVVGKGYDAISKGLDQLSKGVSGNKLVVSL